jgi:U3 small nucleolar RNA-associated protein 12
MVKAYLRYEALASFGVVASTLSNICYDKTGKLAIAPALEEVLVWDLRKGVQVRHRSFRTALYAHTWVSVVS